MAKKNVIIIGGGLGGLSAAISLKQKGYDVSLYEQNNHFGGKLNRLEQDGFGFDLGPSILTMPHVFEKLFKNSGKKMSDYVSIKKLSHQWRAFFPGGDMIDLHENLEDMLEKNLLLSQRDIKDYENLLDYSKALYDATEAGYFKYGFDKTSEVIKHHGLLNAFKQFDLSSTVHGAIKKRIGHKQLRDMLSYITKYVGSSPYDAPAVLNMMIYMQHAEGIWYVSGGMHQLAKALVKLADEIGVKLHKGHKVTRLHKEKGSITQAYLDDGTQLEANYFVSNMEVIPAYEHLLNEKTSYIDKLEKKFEPSSSGLVMHLGVSKNYPQLHHHNFFFAKNIKKQMKLIFHDHQLPDDPIIYLVNVNKTDPSQSPKDHENIKVLPHIPYLQDQPLSKQAYLDFGEKVLLKLEGMGLTGLRDNIVTQDIWTPHDIKRVYGSHRGAIYGTVSNRKTNKGFKHAKQSERYDNLFFVGGTVNPGGGMPMVTLSGQQVAQMISQDDGRHV